MYIYVFGIKNINTFIIVTYFDDAEEIFDYSPFISGF